MYVPTPITDIALLLRHGMLYKKLVASVTKMLDHYKSDGCPDHTNFQGDFSVIESEFINFSLK